jgi:adenine-specific DNA-methyltransferase
MQPPQRPSVRRQHFEKPPLRIQPTTLWEYPSQHYGEGMQGDRNYIGATPSYVIWNVLQRYSREGDLVIDPMCGSGTTLDVANDLKRKARGFDLNPTRPGIERADARRLPLEAASVDVYFVDPP